METADVVIIGGGVIGLSTAYNLVKKQKLNVKVLEKELFVGAGATAACTGGIRLQFSSRLNILFSRLSLPFFKSFEEDMEYPIYYRKNGYLFLTSDQGRWENLCASVKLQNSLQVPTTLLSPAELAQTFPHLETRDLRGGTFCSEDGYADPYGVVEGYQKQAKRLGVEVLTLEEAVGIEIKNSRVCSVITPKRRLHTRYVINAAGPYAARVAKLAGVRLSVEPHRRQVFVANPMPELGKALPLTTDLDTGWYIHQELNGYIIMGGTDKDTAPGFNTAVDRSAFTQVAEAAVKRMPVLENAQIFKAYAGLRVSTPDDTPYLGETDEPRGFFCANGFTGRGFMHAPAIGLLLAEILLEGRPSLPEAEELSPRRLPPKGNREQILF